MEAPLLTEAPTLMGIMKMMNKSMKTVNIRNQLKHQNQKIRKLKMVKKQAV
jgi:hypothetical protein